jgi:transcriptional regulator with XRE-family HTH domain
MTPLFFKIRSIRERQRLTQEYMADQLGISLKTYNEWETGKIKLRTDRLEEIAKILRTTPEDIYAYEDNFIQNNTFNQQHSTAVMVQHTLAESEKKLYEQLLQEKDKRIAALEELVKVLKKG